MKEKFGEGNQLSQAMLEAQRKEAGIICPMAIKGTCVRAGQCNWKSNRNMKNGCKHFTKDAKAPALPKKRKYTMRNRKMKGETTEAFKARKAEANGVKITTPAPAKDTILAAASFLDKSATVIKLAGGKTRLIVEQDGGTAMLINLMFQIMRAKVSKDE